MMPPRLTFGSLPTPLEHYPRLDELIDAEVWVKRDDATLGAEAGNKLRKLEFLLADAEQRGASVVLTCGGLQSNHARATAILAARRGLRALLLLRTSDAPGAPTGNLLLDRLVGAEIRFITPDEYRRRGELLEAIAGELARRGERPYVIPEGGSNALGSLGYVEAVREVKEQLALMPGAPPAFDAVVCACGSGGTAAGLVLGLGLYGVAPRCHAIAVCDDIAYFDRVVSEIVTGAQALVPELERRAELVIHDRFKGPAYGVASIEQRRFIVDVARRSGLVLDPVYTGKALFGLSQLEPRPARVLFVHSGGLPGLLAQANVFEELL
jgi:D-cysteine desulfhydrase